jgi:hypothetical protein
MINKVLKAFFAALGAGISILVGATVEATASWSDISVNTWLTALGAAVSMFAVVYFVPNADSEPSGDNF